jgi:hypothetical protein
VVAQLLYGTSFFSAEILQSIVQYTNKKRVLLQKLDKTWKELDLSELYTYLAILFYMRLYIENDRRLYWSQDLNRPLHQPVYTTMSQDC